jgi:sarcosine oxidase, subunit delta
MLLINCPYCGPRNESEFNYGGPARAPRVTNAHDLSDTEWNEWLMVPDNTMGPVKEYWRHHRGCGLWMTVTRNIVTHEILDVVHAR